MRELSIPTLLLVLLCAVASGCDWYRKPVKIPAGHAAELAKPARVSCWITDKATGKKSIRTVEAWPGWIIGPPEPSSEVK